MPEWIHDRARHILAKNPSMPKSEAFGIATSQAHATGHSPKGYGTAKGRREAKAEYRTPKDDVQTANPDNLSTPKLPDETEKKGHYELIEVMKQAMVDELRKIDESWR
jgi:hypothetical protein